MTIQQLENRTGLERANIRYYEKEGLLNPKRLPNGYRDYSEEDATALEKIMLLRQLELPLEVIRQVQQGTLPLYLALERQDKVLLEQLTDRQQALRLSRQLQTERVTYALLEPDKYRTRLPPPAQRSRLAGEIPDGPWAESAAGHPWMRWLARSLDDLLCMLPAVLLLGLVYPWTAAGFQVLAAIVGTLFSLVLEPLLLCTWGYTPGKWLMGLRLRDGLDRKLSFSDGLSRRALLLFYGQGLNLQLVSLVCGYKSYRRTQTDQRTLPPTPPRDQPWDDGRYNYTLEPRPFCQQVLTPFVWGAVVLLMVLGLAGQAQAPNDGALTVAQYVENVNHILEYRNSPQRLQEDGTWRGSADHMEDYRQQIGTEEGIVTSVTIRYPLYKPGDLLRLDGQLEKLSAFTALCGKELKEEQVASLAAVFEAGEGTFTFNGWQLTQTILDKPADFDRFRQVDGIWLMIDQAAPPPEPIPAIQVVIRRAE